MRLNRQLLQEYAKTHSEDVFRDLVERYLDLVHSVAQRVTRDPDFAKDVSQSVFTKLASQPESVPKKLDLRSWMYRTTRNKAIDLVRSENRRRRREKISYEEAKMNSGKETWTEIEPILEQTLSKLSEKERTLILARFYLNRTHRANAMELGISEDAVRVRTNRALEKLRRNLAGRGITTSAALLGAALSSHAVTTAPAMLSNAITTSAISAVSNTATSISIFQYIPYLIMKKIHLAATAAVAIAVPILISQWNTNKELKAELETLTSSFEEVVSPLPDSKKIALTTIHPIEKKRVVRKSRFDQQILEKSRQYDHLLELRKNSEKGVLPVSYFSQAFVPNHDMMAFFQLSPEKIEQLKSLGQEAYRKIQKIEIDQAEFHTLEDQEFPYGYRIPPLTDQTIAVTKDFAMGVQEILGAEDYALVEPKIQSLFHPLKEERWLKFIHDSNPGAPDSFRTFRIMLSSSDRRGFRQTMALMREGKLLNKDEPYITRYWHLLEPKFVE